MRASTAYFVGAGSIVAAIAIGLGGGIVAGNIMHPIAPKQGPDTGKMAQRAEASAPATTNAPSERVQYITGSQSFGAVVAAPGAEPKPSLKPSLMRRPNSERAPNPRHRRLHRQRPRSSRPSRRLRRLRKRRNPSSSRLRPNQHPHPTTPMPRPGIMT